MDNSQDAPDSKESHGAPGCPEDKRQRVILKSIGRLLVESSLRGDKPAKYPSWQDLLNNTRTYWLEYQDSLLSDCPN